MHEHVPPPLLLLPPLPPPPPPPLLLLLITCLLPLPRLRRKWRRHSSPRWFLMRIYAQQFLMMIR